MTRVRSLPTPCHDSRTEASRPGAEPTLLHEFFEESAARTPDQIAVDIPPGGRRPTRRRVTYAQLKQQSDALAAFLDELTCGVECVVAVILPRESECLYVAQLAALKSGAAYACIDPAFPDEQVRDILADASPVAILTDAAGAARLRHIEPTPVVDVPGWLRDVGDRETTRSVAAFAPDRLAYVIYTSGTTGKPKGVMIEHRSVVNLVLADRLALGVRPEYRVGQNSSSAYDSSVEEIWSAFAAGATLVVMDDETTRLGPDLIGWLRRERVTMFSPPPTLLRSTGCTDPEAELPDLRLLQVGGEVLTQDLADTWARGRCLLNDYGPTECTITALRARIQPGDTITIGRPLPGLHAYVLNDALHEVPDGETGELCLGGVALARGYRNQPERTAQKFVKHPRLGRIYRTGDLVARTPDQTYAFHGRIDAQVKVRGYRIELEAIESRLAECPGVRQAACRVQGVGGQQRLVAFVVPETPSTPLSFDALKTALRAVLPEYMVPSRFGILDRLPTTASGKMNRQALPTLEAHGSEAHLRAPSNDLEETLADSCRTLLGIEKAVSVDDDFFHDLGGDSLQAAQLISILRDDPRTASLAVRDLYETRTLAGLAKRAAERVSVTAVAPAAPRPQGRPMLASLVQGLWLLLQLIAGGPLLYLAAIVAPSHLLQGVGILPSLVLAPLVYGAGVVLYTLLTLALAVLVKKLLIGRYTPLRAPVWGSFYVRNWIVQHVVQLVPWRLLEGTALHSTALRALGARIGQRVHIHHGVNLLQGGWDLLDIGDDVTISQDAALQLVELEDGQVVVGRVVLESGCTLDVRAGVASDTHVEAGAYLTALSFLPRGRRIPAGERWDGVPAKRVGVAPEAPAVSPALSPAAYGVALSVGRALTGLCGALPVLLAAFVFTSMVGVDADHILDWFLESSLSLNTVLLGVGLVLSVRPLTLLLQLVAMRALGRVEPGVVSRWSLTYVRIWLKVELAAAANTWLSGTLLWIHWLRGAGMKIGRGCEISTIIDTVPELVEVGDSAFLADGIYLAGPRLHCGTVTLAPVRLASNTYFGNYVLIAGGQNIPENVLVGVCTVADDRQITPGSSWFGHPPFELPKREVVASDPTTTHLPNTIRYVNRLFWEWLRFALPLLPLLLFVGWLRAVAAFEDRVSLPVLLLTVIPALDFAVGASFCLFGLILKWALLGRVRPAVHPLWSCWCRRWEFHYVAYELYTSGPLSALEGTLFLNGYLRAMGMRLGRHVTLGPGFAYIIDHDMLEFEAGATVNCLFQAHTFEDRVLKIDRVRIRREATVGSLTVVLYGADIGSRTYVAPLSVVMKHERLLGNHAYVGCPTHL